MPKHECLECGLNLAGRDARAEFCTPAHRKAFNNRRALRGAELLDVVMSGRFERETFGNSWQTEVTRLASAYRAADQMRREGRRSWSDPRKSQRRPVIYGNGFGDGR
jgi:hypothetical protein